MKLQTTKRRKSILTPPTLPNTPIKNPSISPNKQIFLVTYLQKLFRKNSNILTKLLKKTFPIQKQVNSHNKQYSTNLLEKTFRKIAGVYMQ